MNDIRHQFSALNTTAEVGLIADDRAGRDLLKLIETRIKMFEKKFSRFISDSELANLNTNPNHEVSVSPEMLEIMRSARIIFDRTNGLIDPMIGRALIEAGYDDSFDNLVEKRQNATLKDYSRHLNFDDITIDESNGTVKLPEGGSLDFGGIGKGYLVDSLIDNIENVTKNYWLSLGGDLIVSGTDDHDRPWAVGVQNPLKHENDIGKITPRSGRWGIATSGITKRRGVVGEREWHHIIDPRTGQPAATDVLGATILTNSALLADAFAKVIIIMGADEGIIWADQQPDCEALAITSDRGIQMTNGMKQYFSTL